MSHLAAALPAGLILSAPASNSGKTVLASAMICALKKAGYRVSAAKSGPDYIDPGFLAKASAAPCINLDLYAMRPCLLDQLLSDQMSGHDLTIIEGAMGLFDAAADGNGSTADLAARWQLPVLLVVNASGQSHSIAALVQGFQRFRGDVQVAGILLNHVASARHRLLLEDALKAINMPVVGAIPAGNQFVLPSRHLGLVQAGEQKDLAQFMSHAGEIFAANADIDTIVKLARPPQLDREMASLLPPLGQNIAIARDDCFSFCYPHMIAGWRQAGAEISFFSPLNDEIPGPSSDAVFLPGGYPELYAERLANAQNTAAAIRAKADAGILIYGECGGYMYMGKGMRDAQGRRWPMLNLLPVETDFSSRKRVLGYRQLEPIGSLPWKGPLRGHEFHYAAGKIEKGAQGLFNAWDARANQLPDMGLRVGRSMGSFAHLIDLV